MVQLTVESVFPWPTQYPTPFYCVGSKPGAKRSLTVKQKAYQQTCPQTIFLISMIYQANHRKLYIPNLGLRGIESHIFVRWNPVNHLVGRCDNKPWTAAIGLSFSVWPAVKKMSNCTVRLYSLHWLLRHFFFPNRCRFTLYPPCILTFCCNPHHGKNGNGQWGLPCCSFTDKRWWRWFPWIEDRAAWSTIWQFTQQRFICNANCYYIYKEYLKSLSQVFRATQVANDIFIPTA